MYEIPVNKKGTINTKKLFAQLHSSAKSVSVVSVPTPSTQTNKKYNADTQYSMLQDIINLQLDKIKLQDNIAYVIIKLMYDNGLRVSEVLNISYYDILPNGNILIKGLKKSNNRIIFSTEFKEFFNNCKKHFITPFNGYDRFYIYRILKSFNISIKTKNSSKNSVTHSFRHLYIHNLKSVDIDLKTIQQQVGHKSIKNTANYGK